MKEGETVSLHNADAIADFTVGLLLGLDRSVVERELMKNHANWRRDVSVSPPYRAVGLMKIGIVGFDEVGRRVAARLLPFGCDLFVYDPAADAQKIADAGCRSAGFDEIFERCDAVTLHMTLPEGEKSIVGSRQFGAMKPTAWLVNVTQAELVDEGALIDAVVNKRIAGVALDVFHQEPLPADYPLIGLPDVILTPHIAGATVDNP